VRTEDADNIGYGFWTHQGSWRRRGIRSRTGNRRHGVATYEYHSEKDGFDLQPGQNATLNWGISQFIPLTSDHHLLLEIGRRAGTAGSSRR
jgi:hypothetical protein